MTVIEVYRWEVDSAEGEDVIELLKERGVEFTDHLPDPEVPNASPCVVVEGKYWEYSDLPELLKRDA